MAKINVRLPEPKQDYDLSNQKQINRAITLMKEQLNSTFLDELKQESERFAFYNARY
ncbi:MAG: hypothetical protein VW810_00310 [Pelagibacteraceae bacterium]